MTDRLTCYRHGCTGAFERATGEALYRCADCDAPRARAPAARLADRDDGAVADLAAVLLGDAA
jgi:hypothetical protein